MLRINRSKRERERARQKGRKRKQELHGERKQKDNSREIEIEESRERIETAREKETCSTAGKSPKKLDFGFFRGHHAVSLHQRRRPESGLK